MEGKTPSYMIKEKIQREKLRGRAEKRTFEESLKRGGGSFLAQLCWRR